MFWIFAIALFAILTALPAISSRFRSPYTLTLIFGLKGAGKSTMMAKMMLADIKHGWTVYTNMNDVCIPGVRIMDSKELMTRVPDPHSAVYIDEAGLVWDNRKFADFNSGYVEYFKLQRKYHNKVVMNSQALDVDKKIRDLVDRMYLMTNILGCIGFARPLKRTIKVLEAQGNSESRLAMNLTFEGLTKCQFFWMPKYWKWFDSFQAPVRECAQYEEVPGELPPKKTMRQMLLVLRRRLERP